MMQSLNTESEIQLKVINELILDVLMRLTEEGIVISDSEEKEKQEKVVVKEDVKTEIREMMDEVFEQIKDFFKQLELMRQLKDAVASPAFNNFKSI